MILKKFIIVFLLLLPGIVCAQTASELDVMLESNTVSAAKAARFVLGAAGLLPEDLSGLEAENAAYTIAFSSGWINVQPHEALTMKNTAFLIMRAFDIKGGIMYTLMKNPRYAYREMVYRNLIPGRTDQSMIVSGWKFLQILDRTMRIGE